MAADNGLHGDGHMMGGQSGMMGSNMMGDSSGMMGGGMMMGDGVSAEHIGQMPADGAFMMVTQTCSACHDRYRLDDD